MRGNFHGSHQWPISPALFDVSSSSKEDNNVPIAALYRIGPSAIAAGSSQGGAAEALRGDDDRNEKGVTPDQSFLNELEQIEPLSVLSISPARTVQSSGGPS